MIEKKSIKIQNNKKKIILDIFNEEEKSLFLLILDTYSLLNNGIEINTLDDAEKLNNIDSEKLNEILYVITNNSELAKKLTEATINTYEMFIKKKNNENDVQQKKEEALKRKGRLPTKKVKVTRRTKKGDIITYYTTVYVKPDKLKKEELLKGIKDSYNRFIKSNYYELYKEKQDFKYKEVYDRAIKKENIDEIDKLFKLQYDETGFSPLRNEIKRKQDMKRLRQKLQYVTKKLRKKLKALQNMQNYENINNELLEYLKALSNDFEKLLKNINIKGKGYSEK